MPGVRIQRVFDATPEQLVRAHTDPDLVVRWLGPRNLTMTIDRWDARTGGEYRYVHHRGEEEYAFHARGREQFRVVQFTPPGSSCSIVFGRGMPTEAEPGALSGMHLVVDDVEAGVADLREKGVEVGDPFHFGESGQGPGVHPERIDDGSYAYLEDPDGNTWLLQEVSDRD